MHKKSDRSYPVTDTLALIVGVAQPIMTIPQIVLVFKVQDSSQISLATWLTYDIASVVLLIYGFKHKLKPIIISQTIWLVVQTVMIAAIFLF